MSIDPDDAARLGDGVADIVIVIDESDDDDDKSVRRHQAEADMPAVKRPWPNSPKSSWIHNHTSIINDRRFCGVAPCKLSWSTKTTTGVIAKHLELHHRLSAQSKERDADQSSTQTVMTQFASISKSRSCRLDSAVVEYVVESTLSHTHTELKPFKSLMEVSVPGYVTKSSRTTKRCILKMYVVLKYMMIALFKSFEAKVSATYDGWSNTLLKGFYSVTVHWVHVVTGELVETLLDFFYILPGEGCGLRCAEAIFNLLCAFGLGDRILVTVSDNGSDAFNAGLHLSSMLRTRFGRDVLPDDHHVRCFTHSFQLGINAAIKVIQPSVAMLRKSIAMLRSGKARRAAFRRFAVAAYERTMEPPCLDVVTQWGSTNKMLASALKCRQAMTMTVGFEEIAKDFVDVGIDLSDEKIWPQSKSLVKWLKLPTKISSCMDGAKYCTSSTAQIASDAAVYHCNQSLSSDDPVVRECSEVCLAIMMPYQQHFNSRPACIAQFLDPRIPKPLAERDAAL
ncbi:hypothetical protein Mp_2g20130 [Marchantia polymorpha subsp. ruderalis]|uniref:HAT C-terminal dimerisation domain-containing protein n=1 Tax=Marchantia polymorpha TaxID=3197 RepID=A0A2R6WV76_MARPO|nr:hypothetical protein MARPO_0055s0032 [Marchantia polymorpha]PTQ37757.1 hypothetical protein MARPO_0055s0036 [Marchantia polymorpha]BBN03031.1 hypothetical protein Mp_2g20130 [Marchantia polymorpha subsp. ruderalis]|eukprot:PTQ37753.1 hypothetical protein MARPO_0055s0032 [Marchantia polymorpha]